MSSLQFRLISGRAGLLALALVALACAGGGGPAEPEPDPPGEVAGTVIRASDGAPVSGAT